MGIPRYRARLLLGGMIALLSLGVGCPVGEATDDDAGGDDDADDDFSDDDSADDDVTSDDDSLDVEDWDGDGFEGNSDDCDDADPRIHPGATEICDGLDDDCDGTVDEGCTICAVEVPGDFGDIQSALDAANAGDVICVSPGVYHENLVWEATALVLLGPAGPHATAIDGSSQDSVVRIEGISGSGASMVGFTITGGHADRGAGSYIHESWITLRNLLVLANGSGSEIGSSSGGGVYVHESSVEIEDVHFEDNSAATYHSHGFGTGDGGGLAAVDSEVSLVRSTFRGNGASNDGGGIHAEGSHIHLDGVVVEANTLMSWGAYSSGLGIHLWECTSDGQDIVIADHSFAAEGAHGAGATLSSSEVSWSRVLVEDNHAAGYMGWHHSDVACGAGIYASGGSLELSQARFHGNQARDSGWQPVDALGGGLYASWTDVQLSNVTFVGNAADGAGGHDSHEERGGGLYLATSTAELVNVAFQGNRARDEGGAVFANSGSTVTLDSCAIWGNEPDHIVVEGTWSASNGITADAGFSDLQSILPRWWDTHLSWASPLVDAGDPTLVDPDGSPSDIGAYGGPGAGDWDLDWDGYPEWWQPGGYDHVHYRSDGWDSDDRDAYVNPDTAEALVRDLRVGS